MNLLEIFAFFTSLGGPEIFMIVLVVLLLFGAKRIPELARGMGKGIREFKDATKEVKNDIEDGLREEPESQKSVSSK